MTQTQITILIATYKRESLLDTLRSLDQLITPNGARLNIVVADNDVEPSARARVEHAKASVGIPITYLHAPACNISLARNACLDAANDADWIAFIDDDELAEPNWLATLMQVAEAQQADAVLGPSIAQYPPNTPTWMRVQDHHSNTPFLARIGLQTGHTCNAILRWNGAAWHDLRFETCKGQSGGEDTAFFHEVSKRGGEFAVAETARVFETIPTERIKFNWLFRRKFRMGQSYAVVAQDGPARLILAARSGIKSTYCAARGVAGLFNQSSRSFWLLRSTFHAGVVAGAIGLPAQRLYGK